MSVLSDATLAGLKVVTPLGTDAIQPSSIDIHLGGTLLKWPYGMVMDPDLDQSQVWVDYPRRPDERWLLGARELYLGATVETITVPRNCVAMLHGVSSLGRLGLAIHVTAGLVDSGWRGNLTLEIVSLGAPIYLRPGMRIGQVTFHRLDQASTIGYSGRYAGDIMVTPSRAHLDAERTVGG